MTVTPINFSDDWCYRLFLARFFERWVLKALIDAPE